MTPKIILQEARDSVTSSGTDDDYGLEADIEELKQQLVAKTSLLLLGLASLTCWLYLTAHPFYLQRFTILLSLVACGALVRYWHLRNPRRARMLLLLWPCIAFAWSLLVWPGASVPFLGIAIVLVNAAVNAPLGYLSAPILTLLQLALARDRASMPMAVACLWLVTSIQWVSTQGLYTAVGWAWNSHRRANGLLRQLRVHQGDLNRTVHALQEATRRLQRTGYELAEARLRAQEARQAKERFAANISHELRTPLNLMVGFSETMYLYPDVYGEMQWPSTLRRDVYQIYQSGRQLSELIDDVLDLSRVDADQMPVRKEESELKEIILQAASSIRAFIKDKDLIIRTQIPPDLPPVSIDRTRIRQVLLNLLKNATRFTDKGEISVEARCREGELVVSVRDTGIGIPGEELSRIFDEFHQLDSSLRRRDDGFGLGLAISKRFVGLHGGRIWAESVLGQGSTFHFSLPLEPARSGQQLRETERGLRAPAKPSLLLLEADHDLQNLLARYLVEYDILLAADTGAARDMVARHHPAALLVNVPPERLGEREVYDQALRTLPPRVPVLFYSIPSADWMAKRLGVAACLAKPLDRASLVRALSCWPGASKLLIVDDDQGFVELVRRYLAVDKLAGSDKPSLPDYLLRSASDGAEALDLMARWRPDLVLLDLIMPRVDGFAVLEQMGEREDLRDVPVVIVTASPYGDELLVGHGSAVTIARGEGYVTSEVVQKLKVLLQTSRAEYPIPALPPGPRPTVLGG